MTHSVAPKLIKWPFIAGDLVLVAFAAIVAFQAPGPMNGWQLATCLAATGAGAWLCVLPFLREYQAAIKLDQALVMAASVPQMKNLEHIRTQIASATEQWQTVREHSTQTVAAAREIADRMKAQLTDFCAFLQKAQDSEASHSKLEVEKLRRSERDWLQATVLVLDHVYALHAAAVRTGQPGVVAQLSQFQFACRDAMRRVGLVGFAPTLKDVFNPQVHQLEDATATPQGAVCVNEILALGYTYQGELVRKALVKVEPAKVDSTKATDTTDAATPTESGNDSTQAEAST